MSEATFRFTVNIENIKEEYIVSPPFYICNFPWAIEVQARKVNEQKFLGVFLQCNERITSSIWSCYAEADLRIIAHEPDAELFGREIQHLFNDKESGWGFAKFMPWEDCVNPQKGYIKDDAITLEAHVIANNIKLDDSSTETTDQTRSEATLHVKVDNCDNIETLSSPIHIFNFPCQIKMIAQKMMFGPPQSQTQHLGLKLNCTRTNLAVNCNWSCNVNLDVQVISDKDKPFYKKIDHFLFGTEEENIPIIPWASVLNPTEGYIKDHVITMKIKVTTAHVQNTIIGGYKLGKLLIEGKTKQVFDLPDVPGHCLLLNKDRITAGDGVKAHDLEGKAAISNQTNAKVFEILKSTGLQTAYVKIASPTAFVSKKCEMIPIEWVTRRLATGSFLKRNPGVPEGFRFTPPKQETFYKDDANHDPQWSEEQIICANFKVNGLVIGRNEVDYMRKATILVFEILEKAWALRDCALIDMKIEFGVDTEGNILLADVIDSDSWRLWPSGDKRLMVDKQVYRNLATVTAADLDTVKRNFAWVKDQLDHLQPRVHHKVVVFMGSAADQEHCQKIAKAGRELGLNVDLRVTSAHKATSETLQIMQQYEDTHGALVFVAVAGRSNGLGPVLAGNTSYPVINCPPPSDKLVQDIWSSLSVPSGLGCATVIYPDSAALMAAQIIGLQDYLVWARLRVKQLQMATALRQADSKLQNLTV